MEAIVVKVIFIIAFVWIGLHTFLRVFSSCRQRTYLEFTSGKEIWRDVERWAKREGYKLKSHSEAEKIYKKNSLGGAGPYLLIRQNDDKVHVESWFGISSNVEVAVDDTSLFCKLGGRKSVMPINRLLTILGSSMKIRESCRTRAIWDFTSSKGIWSDVEYWAKEEGYKLKSRSGKERVYKKGSFWMDPDTFQKVIACLLISQEGDGVHIEAWMESGAFTFKKEIAVMRVCNLNCVIR